MEVRSLGDPEQDRQRERRSLRFSDDQPAGRFVGQGDELVVTVPTGVRGLEVQIGQYGVYRGLNDGEERDPFVTTLSPGTNRITAPQEGLVTLRDAAPAGSRSSNVTVTGGTAVPTFVAGTTEPTAFDAAVRASTSPFAILIGRRTVAEMQRDSVERLLPTAGAATQVGQLDRAVDLADRTWGLDRGGSGVSARSAQRVLVASPDTGGGYASATHGHVDFQVGTDADQEILAGKRADQWGFWHEVGHIYQPDFVTWDELTETSVNITSLSVQQALGFRNRLDDDERQPDVDEYFALPVEERHFNDAEGWVKLLMFDQLTRAFGADFFARLSQEDRVQAVSGVAIDTSSDAAMQRFGVLAATLADRDLRPFFHEWGFQLTADTDARLAKLPALRNPIWTSRDSTAPLVERTVTFTPPSATLTATGSATVGQRVVGRGIVTDLSRVEGGAAAGKPVIAAWTPGAGAGRVVQRLVAPDGTSNAAIAPVDVVHGTDITFLGLGDEELATLALDAASGRLSVDGPQTSDAHSYFDGEYIGVSLRHEDRSPIADATVSGAGKSDGLAAGLDGVPYHDGDLLEVRHREAGARLHRWDQGAEVPPSDASTQTFRISADRLIPVSDGPGDAVEDHDTADRLELLGIGDETDARLAIRDGRLVATVPWDASTHPYFGDRQYFAVTVVSPTGARLAAAAATGDQTASALARALDGLAVPDGSSIVVEHAEAETRLLALSGTERLAPSSATTQVFDVVGHRFAPTTKDPVSATVDAVTVDAAPVDAAPVPGRAGQPRI